MNSQFNILINVEDLANAGVFLKNEGAVLKSRNHLVSSALKYLAQLAEDSCLETAKNQGEALDFLIKNGLAGNSSKAEGDLFMVKKGKELTLFKSQHELAMEILKEKRRNPKKLSPEEERQREEDYKKFKAIEEEMASLEEDPPEPSDQELKEMRAVALKRQRKGQY
jgi:hypothetical protein